jgi:polyhydroxyalkanoate synthase subunit PhaC
MIPFQMRPDEILQEARDFNEKLAKGVGNRCSSSTPS